MRRLRIVWGCSRICFGGIFYADIGCAGTEAVEHKYVFFYFWRMFYCVLFFIYLFCYGYLARISVWLLVFACALPVLVLGLALCASAVRCCPVVVLLVGFPGLWGWCFALWVSAFWCRFFLPLLLCFIGGLGWVLFSIRPSP